METHLTNRPFNNFRLPITDTNYFFGRSDLIAEIVKDPFQVRILLGGRRIGKTSTLNKIASQLSNTEQNQFNRAFPVFINLQQEQPSSPDNFRYLLIKKLQEAVLSTQFAGNFQLKLQQKKDRTMRQISEGSVNFLGNSLKVNNPAIQRSLINEDFLEDLTNIIKSVQDKKWTGICFLFDGAEFLVRQDWANKIWGYMRGLKENINLSAFLGYILSGYSDLKTYQQKTGSPLLGIATIHWLCCLKENEMKELIQKRYEYEKLTIRENLINTIIKFGGNHPYLTQQLINAIIDNQKLEIPYKNKEFIKYLIRQHDKDFSKWWDENNAEYGFSSNVQSVYLCLRKYRKASSSILSQDTDLAEGEVDDALDILVSTGVVHRIDFDEYRIGSRLFAYWVDREIKSN